MIAIVTDFFLQAGGLDHGNTPGFFREADGLEPGFLDSDFAAAIANSSAGYAFLNAYDYVEVEVDYVLVTKSDDFQSVVEHDGPVWIVSYFVYDEDWDEYELHVVIDAITGAYLGSDTGTSIENPGSLSPNLIKLDQNYPNPFNPSTQIRFELLVPAVVKLEVFEITGRRIATLVDAQLPSGNHTVSFDASGLASGIYMYRLSSGSTIITSRMTLLK